MKLVLNTTREGVRIEVRVAPRASRARVVGVQEGALKIALTAPPVEGEANEALVAFLADALGIARRDVRIVRGHQSRRKTLELVGVAAAAVARLEANTTEGRSHEG